MISLPSVIGSVASAAVVLAVVCGGGCRQNAASSSTVRQPAATLPAPRPITFNKDVAPILFAKCASCHRPANDTRVERLPNETADPLCIAGAPFSVLDYAATRRRASAIAAAVERREMPPWLPEPGHTDFANERRLRDDEIAVITQWVAQGAPEGDAGDRPPAPEFAGGWQLGKPDLVLDFPESYELRAGRGDVFRTFVVPVSLPSTRFVRGIEFRTDNPRVLHHANVAVDPGRISRALDRADPGPGFAVMPEDDGVQNVFGWSPGKVPVLEPSDTAWALEPGADLVVQLHMVASPERESVRPSIGLFFSERPPTRSPIVIKLESKSIDIPAGESRYVVEDRYVLRADVDALSVYPHAHYLAAEMEGRAVRPDGTMVPLLSIRRWDVRWQDQYRYRTPVFLPRGTTVSMRFVYDNSAANRNNPHRPPRRVTWGPMSTDEMGALWLEVVPRRAEDAALLTADYFRRAQAANVAAAELAVRASPGDGVLHNRLALKYLQAGRVADARVHLDEALRLNPADAIAHSNLGTLLQGQGKLDEALRHLRESYRLKPDDDRVRFNLGNGLYAAGRVGEAIAEFRSAIRLNPENADAHFNLAMLLGPQNRVSEAITHLHRVVEINPRNGEAYRNLAVAYGLQGRISEAIPHARAAVRLQPQSAAAREQLERLLAASAR
jgi:Flp pilus assembly protein TadD